MASDLDLFSSRFGKLLRLARRDRGFTQLALATEIGAHDTYVSRWEKGVLSPTLGQLHDVRKALALSDQVFESMYFAWLREQRPVPDGYRFRRQRLEDLIVSLETSIQAARQLRRAGRPQLAMELSNRDAILAFDRIRSVSWSNAHPVALTRAAALILEQCKSGLDFLSRPEVKNGAMTDAIAKLQHIAALCPSHFTQFVLDLAIEGTTYVGGDVAAAFLQSNDLLQRLDTVPKEWRYEVLRAAAINAGKLKERSALESASNQIDVLTEEAPETGDAAFVLEGLARGWSHVDPGRGSELIERAWKMRQASESVDRSSMLRHVQLVRSEAEIAHADPQSVNTSRLRSRLADAVKISRNNQYDRYVTQLEDLLKEY